jgi:hypothetical protein
MSVLKKFLDNTRLIDLSNLLLIGLEQAQLVVGITTPCKYHFSLSTLPIIVVLITLVQRFVIADTSIISVSLVWCSKLNLIISSDSSRVCHSATSWCTDGNRVVVTALDIGDFDVHQSEYHLRWIRAILFIFDGSALVIRFIGVFR